MSNKTSDIRDPTDYSPSYYSGSGICYPIQSGQLEFELEISHYKSSASIILEDYTYFISIIRPPILLPISQDT
jgi:hypothetical protein